MTAPAFDPTARSELGAIRSALVEAQHQAEIAYEFSPGSYTYSALLAVMRAVTVLNGALSRDNGEDA